MDSFKIMLIIISVGLAIFTIWFFLYKKQDIIKWFEEPPLASEGLTVPDKRYALKSDLAKMQEEVDRLKTQIRELQRRPADLPQKGEEQRPQDNPSPKPAGLKLFANAPIDSGIFMDATEQFRPGETMFEILPNHDGKTGKFLLVSDEYTRSKVIEMIDVIRYGCDIKSTGKPSSPSDLTQLPGTVLYEDSFWKVKNKMTLQWS